MSRAVPWTLRLLVALALLYTLDRALVLRVEYFDGYAYLTNARVIAGDRLWGYDILRPPFVPLLQLPAVALARSSPPASPVRLIAPHLTAALLSSLAAAAVFWCLRGVFPPPFPLLGTLLFVGGRYFVHYGAHVMADVPSAGLSAAAVAAYLRARARRSLAAWGFMGALLGCGALTKFPLVLLGPALGAAELWYTVRVGRPDARAWAGLVLAGVVAAAVFVAVDAVVCVVLFGPAALAALWSVLSEPARVAPGAIGVFPGESWTDWGAMARVMLSDPVLVLAAVGFIVAIAKREDRDVPFVAWFLGVGGSVVGMIGHTEARYLLPVVPAVIYFTLRGLEWLGRRAGVARLAAPLAGVAVLAGGLVGGVRQAWRDRDPVFLADVERRAAEQLLQTRSGSGRLVWAGGWHTLAARTPVAMPEDEFFDVFHFSPQALEYLVDERVATWPPDVALEPDTLALRRSVRDGDAILRVAASPDQVFTSLSLPAGGVPPLEAWAIRRLVLDRGADGAFVARDDPTIRVELVTADGGPAIRSARDLGRWTVYAPDRRGEVTLAAGVAVPLEPGPPEAQLVGLVLFRLERAEIR